MEKILSIIATNGNRLSDLPISEESQLIFIQDKSKIALDFNGKRKFYNDIEVINTDQDRLDLTPENGRFYFVVGTAVLWFYQDEWTQLTSTPENVLFIGTELPDEKLGSENKLYINKNNRNISVWDNGTYITVGEVTSSISNKDIDALFK